MNNIKKENSILEPINNLSFVEINIFLRAVFKKQEWYHLNRSVTFVKKIIYPLIYSSKIVCLKLKISKITGPQSWDIVGWFKLFFDMPLPPIMAIGEGTSPRG